MQIEHSNEYYSIHYLSSTSREEYVAAIFARKSLSRLNVPTHLTCKVAVGQTEWEYAMWLDVVPKTNKYFKQQGGSTHMQVESIAQILLL